MAPPREGQQLGFCPSGAGSADPSAYRTIRCGRHSDCLASTTEGPAILSHDSAPRALHLPSRTPPPRPSCHVMPALLEDSHPPASGPGRVWHDGLGGRSLPP